MRYGGSPGERLGQRRAGGPGGADRAAPAGRHRRRSGQRRSRRRARPRRRDRQEDRLRPRAFPTPAATTRSCPPTAGRWRDWCGPWRRRPVGEPGPRAACRSSRSTSAVAARRAAPSPPAPTSPRRAAAPPLSPRSTTAAADLAGSRWPTGSTGPAWAGTGWPAAPARPSRAARKSGSCSKRSRARAARDPARPRPVRVPGRRDPALAVERQRLAIRAGRAERPIPQRSCDGRLGRPDRFDARLRGGHDATDQARFRQPSRADRDSPLSRWSPSSPSRPLPAGSRAPDQASREGGDVERRRIRPRQPQGPDLYSLSVEKHGKFICTAGCTLDLASARRRERASSRHGPVLARHGRAPPKGRPR